MKKLLVTAGVVTVALFAYKTLNGGSLGLPPALSALISPAKNGPMKRDFPSHAKANTPEVGAALAADQPDADSAPGSNAAFFDGMAGGAQAQGAGLGAGTPTFGDEDVNTRIARAMELSRTIEATGATPAGQKNAGATAHQSAVNAPYAGAWTGKFTGPDAGTVSVEVDQNGLVRGHGVSTLTGIGFSLSGKVQSNGQVEMVQSTAGVTSTGATFTGALDRAGRGTGTWAMAAYNVSGNWQLDAKPTE